MDASDRSLNEDDRSLKTNIPQNIGYSPEEAHKLEQSFAPVAERARRRKLFGFCLFMAGIIVGWCFSGNNVAAWKIALILIPAPVGIVILASASKLQCPGCRNGLPRMGEYCPKCGSRGLELKTGFWRPRFFSCANCRRTFQTVGKNRSFSLRFCSHCGLLLDRKGVNVSAS